MKNPKLEIHPYLWVEIASGNYLVFSARPSIGMISEFELFIQIYEYLLYLLIQIFEICHLK